MGTNRLTSNDLALQGAIEVGSARPDPVVEFARKKSTQLPANTENGDQPSAHGEPGSAQWLSHCRRIVLPKDRSNPLVTTNDRSTVAAAEAYKSLRTRLLKSQNREGFRSVAITSAGRSDGKTLTAFNLACCCAQVEGLPVLLIDGDLRSRSLTTLIGPLPQVGLADVVGGIAPYEEAIVRTDIPNLYVMGAGVINVSPTELFSTEKWNQLILWAQEHFKLVLIDALSMGSLADFDLIAGECERILVVVRAGATLRDEFKTAIDQLDPKKLVGVVLNASYSNSDYSYS